MDRCNKGGDLGQFDPSPPPCTLQAYDSIKDSGQKPYGIHNRQHHLKTDICGQDRICPFRLYYTDPGLTETLDLWNNPEIPKGREENIMDPQEETGDRIEAS